MTSVFVVIYVPIHAPFLLCKDGKGHCYLPTYQSHHTDRIIVPKHTQDRPFYLSWLCVSLERFAVDVNASFKHTKKSMCKFVQCYRCGLWFNINLLHGPQFTEAHYSHGAASYTIPWSWVCECAFVAITDFVATCLCFLYSPLCTIPPPPPRLSLSLSIYLSIY